MHNAFPLLKSILKQLDQMDLVQTNHYDTHKIILIFHVFCGVIALLTGLIAIIAMKGSRLHITSGKGFYLAMFAVGILSFILASIKFNPFLLSIGIFSLYMVIRGRRALFYYRLIESYNSTMIDKLPVYLGLLTAIFMIVYPGYMIVFYHSEGIFILIIFGSILSMMVYSDLKILYKNSVFLPYHKKWIFKHIVMMLGTYIAATTAFLVNVVKFDPPWVLCLSPTVVGVLTITYFNKQWRIKLKEA